MLPQPAEREERRVRQGTPAPRCQGPMRPRTQGLLCCSGRQRRSNFRALEGLLDRECEEIDFCRRERL
ncbi:hypothetical protein DUNSADRAFT_14801 [Dunaliella salina]|uniref:Encoded protein n=1 Tax=Dunaliella salina TaxID=3046 RepID=A0ABQ7G6T1_DUNSA|nr:hypothetical protein DUNSADRAFT_14801 [Dunaliella salina]|eukprot:KAF5830279.1 hypothetical protein DUNSADRAFT_14801 [Dunaliella salina]